MKELRVVNGWFLDKDNGDKPQCAFMVDRACTPDCTACEINQGGLQKTATCLRGSFVFASISET